MIQQAGKAPGAQGGEGKSFPSAELCSAAKQVIDHDTSSSEQGTCSSSLHFTEGKEGILAVSLPSSSAFTAGNRMLEECGIPQPSSPSSRVGSTSTAKPLQFSAQLINTNWKRCGLTYQAANCSAWCMDLARRPFRRDAGNGEDFGYLFTHSCTNSQKPRSTITDASWFCISNHHQLQICFSELYWPAPFLKNTHSSNFVENQQLTCLIQTWTDYCCCGTGFGDKNQLCSDKNLPVSNPFTAKIENMCYHITDTCLFTPTEEGLSS